MDDKTMQNVLIFGAVGLAAWWIYDTYFSTPSIPTPTSTSAAASSVATSAPSAPATPAPITCPTGYTLTNGSCVPPIEGCPSGYSLNANGVCAPSSVDAAQALRYAIDTGTYVAGNTGAITTGVDSVPTGSGPITGRTARALNGLGILVNSMRAYGR